MTVPVSIIRVQYDGNGAQTTFPYTFRILEGADLVVIYTDPAGTDTTWTLNNQYTVTGAGNVNGGNVVVKTTPTDYTPPALSKLTIYRSMDITQESDYVENDPYHAETLEDDLDKGTMIDQQLADQLSRAILVPATDDEPGLELPSAAERANKYLKFDADGDAEVVDLPEDNIETGVDNHVARYDGTEYIQDSLVIIGDSGVITTPTGDSDQWDDAYGWGNHALAGYVTEAELAIEVADLEGALTTHKSSSDHDGRYYTETELNAGQLDDRYYTKTQLDTGSLDPRYYTQSQLNNGQLDTRYYTEIQLDNGQLDDRYYTETEVNALVNAVDSALASHKISNDHDSRYYTETEIDSMLSNYATESYADTISGALHAEIENIDLTNYYTKAEITTISGDIVAQINASGTLDHSALLNLDYASSGHTGFQASGDYVTTATLTTVSGDIVAGYEAADTTLSGLLHAEIVAASGTTDHSVLDNLDYTSSGHTGFQASGDYVTESEFTTYSGDIIAQIPTDYISDAEMTTISGNLIDGYVAADTTVYNNSVIYTDTIASGINVTLTSHTSDSTIHFTVASISHSAIDNLDADDHTQYHNDTRGDARYFTQSQITTQSGDIVSQIITDHGLLTGREDDDHTQYILVNGNRAFTGTVAGVTPSADEHLATKGYVDAAWGTGLSVAAGTQVLVSGTSSTTIDFGIEFLSTGYGLACEMQNLVDANPSIYDMTITEVTTSGCSLEFSGVIDSGNYYLRYTAIASGTVSSTDHGALSGLLDDDHPQYYNEARGDIRYYTQAQVNTISGTLESSKANVVHTHVKADILDLGTPISNVVEDTTPQLGGDLDLNGKSLNYGTILTSSGTYVGDYFTATVDDASSVFGSVLYQGADFNYDRADADSTTTSPVFVLALEAGTGSKKLLIRGQVCDTAWNWSAGKLYLSTDTGLMTQTKPSGSGDIIQVLGFALSADTIWFDPVTMVAEVA